MSKLTGLEAHFLIQRFDGLDDDGRRRGMVAVYSPTIAPATDPHRKGLGEFPADTDGDWMAMRQWCDEHPYSNPPITVLDGTGMVTGFYADVAQYSAEGS